MQITKVSAPFSLAISKAWDLKNNFGIPIASGLYIIHVATEIDGEKREKVIKWFGTLRPIDLDTF